MNKLLKVLAASALVATVLVGCGKKGETGGDATTAAKYAKAGLGVVSSYSEDGQVNTTMAAVGLDADGKVQYIDIDVAQSTPGGDSEKTQTKKELKEDYGMKSVSASMGVIKDGGEWYEQAEYLENYCKGKTAEEIANIETEKRDEEHTSVPKSGSDLTAGCTMDIGTFKEAIAKAIANAQDANAEKIGVGEVMSNGDAQLDTTIALVATDADGKVVYSKIDVAQINKDVTATKSERKDDYGMKSVSASMGVIEGGAEWYQQAEAFEKYCKGKTADQIANTETEKRDDEHPAVPKSGSDLAAGCTMNIGDFLEAMAEAFANAK